MVDPRARVVGPRAVRRRARSPRCPYGVEPDTSRCSSSSSRRVSGAPAGPAFAVAPTGYRSVSRVSSTCGSRFSVSHIECELHRRQRRMERMPNHASSRSQYRCLPRSSCLPLAPHPGSGRRAARVRQRRQGGVAVRTPARPVTSSPISRSRRPGAPAAASSPLFRQGRHRPAARLGQPPHPAARWSQTNSTTSIPGSRGLHERGDSVRLAHRRVEPGDDGGVRARAGPTASGRPCAGRLGRIHFAGEHTDAFAGTMEGAVRSGGERSAHRYSRIIPPGGHISRHRQQARHAALLREARSPRTSSTGS